MVTSLEEVQEMPEVSSLQLEDTMNELLGRHLALSASQIDRIACVSVGMLLAGTSQLSKVARWLGRDSQQNSRLQYVSRILDAEYVNQTDVYQPLLGQALCRYNIDTWHIAMDRSTIAEKVEVLAITLNVRKRSIPLIWQTIDFGCTGADEQIALIEHVLPLIPAGKPVVFHGDSEFGAVDVMRYVQRQGWNFILGQPGNTLYRWPGHPWQRLDALPVKPRKPIYLSQVEWTEKHAYGPLNVFAFYAPHQNAPFADRRDIRYCATSLPIAHTLRRRGRRRWGIEPFFRDFKSSGWHIESSALTDRFRLDRLLTLLSVNYLWATCIGRWLCKLGRRSEIDAWPNRHLSLFRIGYDWLIHKFVLGQSWPSMLTLYA
jgi:hypothetical protein